MLQGKIRGIWEEAITGISSLLNRIKSLLSNTLSAPRHLKAQVREVEGSNDPPSGSLQGACLGCSTEAVRLPLKTETTSSFHRERQPQGKLSLQKLQPRESYTLVGYER